ncbi:hypothetical protein [Frankia sp. CiP1_Cm_nod2]|uniref:hypothetical protein n=1 Tax=Frankia sp. CiP1_Cm_nod2 TaxID=2897161 RepID=UPI0020255631
MGGRLLDQGAAGSPRPGWRAVRAFRTSRRARAPPTGAAPENVDAAADDDDKM